MEYPRHLVPPAGTRMLSGCTTGITIGFPLPASLCPAVARHLTFAAAQANSGCLQLFYRREFWHLHCYSICVGSFGSAMERVEGG